MRRVHRRRFSLISAALLVAGFCALQPGSVQADANEPGSALPVVDDSAMPREGDESLRGQQVVARDTPLVVSDTDFDIEHQLSRDGSARVLIQLATDVEPEATLSSWQQIVERRAAITFDQNEVSRALSTTGSTISDRFQLVCAVAAEITTEGLQVLQSLPNVRSIEPDIAVPPVLDGTVGIIEADEMWSSGYTGSGYAVAVLDTGVQTDHPMFSDGNGGTRVVAEACYSTNFGSSIVSLCPGQAAQSVATGSGMNCDNTISGCDHGTHVAEIAAGGSWNTGSTTISGVAPDADIIAMQVFTKFISSSDCYPYAPPCVLSYSSDQLKALDRVSALSASHDIAAVNMSLGGGRHYSACDSTATIASAVEALSASGIATVIAAGNSGFSDSVASPACISSAVTVGSTTNGDLVSSFSNAASNLIDVYAPGYFSG